MAEQGLDRQPDADEDQPGADQIGDDPRADAGVGGEDADVARLQDHDRAEDDDADRDGEVEEALAPVGRILGR
jgi:hypothetical protein